MCIPYEDYHLWGVQGPKREKLSRVRYARLSNWFGLGHVLIYPNSNVCYKNCSWFQLRSLLFISLHPQNFRSSGTSAASPQEHHSNDSPDGVVDGRCTQGDDHHRDLCRHSCGKATINHHKAIMVMTWGCLLLGLPHCEDSHYGLDDHKPYNMFRP